MRLSRLHCRCLLILCVVLIVGSAGTFAWNSSSADVGPGPSQPLFAGGRLAVFPGSQTEMWLRDHPSDPRTATLRTTLGGRATGLWLTGSSRDLANIRDYLDAARRTNATPIIVLYNISGRDDGVSGPQRSVGVAGYRAWVDSISSALGGECALMIVEPDALWLADRQFAGDRRGLSDRLDELRYAVNRLSSQPSNAVYVEAGTSSGSVSTERMAQLLDMVGVSQRVGFAVNVSSFAPQPDILDYAGRIRLRLWQLSHVSTRFVVDTSRNGRQLWDKTTWCNPPGRKVGQQPGTTSVGVPGLDVNLWVKAPGTSDGDCGVGRGTRGGDFMPEVALDMVG